jgi:hypothetical protein
MSWSNAKLDAGRILPVARDGRRVLLPDYADAAALVLFGAHPGWSLTYYRMVLRAAARDQKKAGHKIRFLKIASDDYLAWLHGRAGTPALRAGFIASLVAKMKR